ncbi:hypothetical protein EIZ39_19785 [Ammoniphilus sp. CFH 90114]|nr:hypothetical protein EIZ39_19785 [Ammoniphilus sp. CFH 90114]
MLKDIYNMQERNWRQQYLIDVINQYNDKEVAIYGTGSHTEWLLSKLGSQSRKLLALVDQNSSYFGTLKFDLPIHSLEYVIEAGVKAIVISSSFEQEIYGRIKHIENQGIKIIQLYSHEILDTSSTFIVNRIKETCDGLNIHTFIDRRKRSEKLLVVLAGYKEYLWPFTLERIAHYAPKDLDVCLTSSGLYSQKLADMAERNNWSYLYTTLNEVSLTQNLAISNHPDAKWIYKMDEDIFISNQYFENLLLGYQRIDQEGLYNPGFVAPLINLNGYSYIYFLQMFGLDKEYKETFKELSHAANGIKCHYSPEAARWIWKNSLPINKISRIVTEKPFSYSVIPHRFSIGAILLKRDYWSKLGGFKVSVQEGMLGVDEEDLCRKCVEYSRVMCLVHNVFAGHFSFFPQEKAMKEFLNENQFSF